MKRVALYIRVSTEEQVRHGLSLGDQREALVKYARDHGYVIAGEYQDAGISAHKPYTKRPALLRLLDDCRAGRVDMVLFIRLDRWFRNVQQYYKVQEVLDQCRVTWAATEEDYETDTPSGRFKVNIMLAVAQDEAERDGERIRFTCAAKRAKGLSTNARAPYGIKVVDSHYQPDPDTADAARDMFAEYIRCQSLCALRRYMAEKWGLFRSYSKYKLYMQNRLYLGEAYGVPGALEPIISPETFALANEILSRRSQRNSSSRTPRTYLFSGLLRCRECGKPMNGEYLKGYTYYRCHTHSISAAECPHKRRVREDVLEDYLRHEIHSILSSHYAALKRQQKKSPSQSTDKILRKLERLKELYLNELIGLDEYKADSAALKLQLEAIEPPTPITEPDFARIDSQLKNYESMDYLDKKAFWSSIISKIQADDNLSFFVTPR